MSFPIPIDLTGKLSAPFLLGKRAAPRSSSGTRNGNVRWKDLSAGSELWSNGQNGNGNGRYNSSQDDMAGSGRREEGRYKRQEREKDLRPRLGERRRSSNEDVIRRERDREREREREREMVGRGGGGSGSAPDSRSFRERERRGGSPVRGVDGRRYPGH
jgi:hypothetical protein